MLRKRVAMLVAAAIMVLSMLAAAAPAFAQYSAAGNQYSGSENQSAPPAGQNQSPPPAGQNPDAGRIEAPQSDGNVAPALSGPSLSEALSNTIWTNTILTGNSSGGGSATCAPGGAWGGMIGWPEGCFTGPDQTVIPGSTPGSASSYPGLVPSDGGSSVIPGYQQDPTVSFPGFGMTGPVDGGVTNQIFDKYLNGG